MQWFEIVEEGEEEAARSVPVHFPKSAEGGSRRKNRGLKSNKLAAAEVSDQGAAAAQVWDAEPGFFSAAAEISSLSLPRQTITTVSTAEVLPRQEGSADHTGLLPLVFGSPTAPSLVSTKASFRGAPMSPVASPKTPIRSSTLSEGTGVFLGGRILQFEVIAYGGIFAKAALGVRSSERIRAQPNADATQLERAKQVALAWDSPLVSGTKSITKFSIASIPNDVVVARASRLGVLLGESPSQIVSSVNLIKILI
jgi:hypothetical protein